MKKTKHESKMLEEHSNSVFTSFSLVPANISGIKLMMLDKCLPVLPTQRGSASFRAMLCYFALDKNVNEIKLLLQLITIITFDDTKGQQCL